MSDGVTRATSVVAIVSNHIYAVCRVLENAESSDEVLSFARHVAGAYLPLSGAGKSAITAPIVESDEELSRATRKLDELCGLRGREALQDAFWRAGFSTFAETLLSVVLPRWSASIGQKAMAADIEVFFENGRASSTLTALLAHLSSVQPLEVRRQHRSAAVTAPSARLAARLLTQRFARRGAPGLAQLVAETTRGSPRAERREEDDSSTTELHQIASELASVPERAASLWLPELQPGEYVPSLVGNILGLSEDAAEVPDAALRGFAGAVLARIVKRGYSQQVASVLWGGSQQKQSAADESVIGWCLGCMDDPAATEKLLESLVNCHAEGRLSQRAAVHCMEQALLQNPAVLGIPGVRYTLQLKLLVHRILPPRSLRLLTNLLSRLSNSESSGIDLQLVSAELAQAWASEESIARLSVPRQAHLTAALMLLMQSLGRAGVEGSPDLTAALLTGVSARLESPLDAIRCQGMRVGNAYAETLGSESKPFDGELGFTAAESWHRSCEEHGFGLADKSTAVGAGGSSGGREPPASGIRHQTSQLQSTETQAAGAETGESSARDGSEAETATDSDDSLEAYDVNEDEDEEVDMAEDKPIQLRQLAEMLAKSGEPVTVVKALRLAPLLIEAAPDELQTLGAQLVRALLFCQPPEWADQEAASDPEKPGHLRLRAMSSLLVRAPREGGLTLAAEIYSPHLDLHQRLLILDTMAAAATEMSTPPSRRAAIGPASPKEEAISEAGGKTRRWGARSLALRKATEEGKTFRNRFPEVAAEWISCLLEECGKERHGVDLFGRDMLLLSRLLITLGVFVQATAPAIQTAAVAAATLEMLRLAPVHAHPQPLVRRAALLTASQVLRALPPARVAASLAEGGRLRQDGLMERLEWLQGWLSDAGRRDSDPEVQMLARGCQSLQSDLASQALQSLDLDDVGRSSIPSRGPSQLLGLEGSRRQQPALKVQLPELSSSLLPP